MRENKISIIGLGKVGTAWLKVLTDNGYKVVSVFNRSEVPGKIQNQYPKVEFYKTLPSKESLLGDFLILAVSDDAIQEVANNLVNIIPSFDHLKVIHCSGTHSSGVLAPLEDKGALTASFHPLNSITTAINSFEGIWFDMEGAKDLLNFLEDMAESLNAHTFIVQPEAKPYLHASAVVASNYLVVLADLVTKISSMGNVKEDVILKAITPLMENTLQNVNKQGVTAALTGPISRGDISTIRKHLEILENEPELSFLYKILGRRAVTIAESNGDSPKNELKNIKKILS